MRNYTVLIVTNSDSDLTTLKFDGYRILNVLSEEFEEFCNKTGTAEELLLKFKTEYQYMKQERYAIMWEDISQPATKKVDDVYSFLLLLFPSILSVEFVLSYQAEEKFTRYLDSYEADIKYDRAEYLYFDEDDIEDINSFIAKYFGRHLERKILQFPIVYYINAFESNLFHFSYVAFCISLEGLIQGNQELMYRIRRTVAIICGFDEESSEIIFDNMSKLYDLRSKIVHGEKFDEELVSNYLYYLECLVSKTIIELLVHEVDDLKLLGKQITKLGFGDREKISEKWRKFTLNLKVEDTIYKRL